MSSRSVYSTPPIVSNVVLNNNQNIDLTENTTTAISITATVSDPDGYGDISNITAKMFRSGVASAQNCTLSNEACYQTSTCSLSGCSGNSCTATCNFSIQYYADATDASSAYASQSWQAFMQVRDATNEVYSAISPPDVVDVNTFSAININSVNFGSILPGANSGGSSPMMTITNTSNNSLYIDISGDDLCHNYPDCGIYFIPVGNIQYDRTLVLGSGTTLSGSPTALTTINKLGTDTFEFGISVPVNIAAGTYGSQISFAYSSPPQRPSGAQCTVNSDCQNNSCLPFHRDADGDSLGAIATVKFCSTGTTPWGYIVNGSDLDDTQYCPSHFNYNPGTCQKCNSGAVINQTASEDQFDQCIASTTCSVNKCGIAVQNGLCSGSGNYCNPADISFVSAGKVCSSGFETDATSQPLSCDNTTHNNCSVGSCGGNYRFSECDGSGSCDTAATTNYQQYSVVASANNVLTNACGQQAGACASSTCKNDSFCNGISASCPTQTNKPIGTADAGCPTITCSNYTWGFNSGSCYEAADNTSANGKCSGGGMCYTAFSDVCIQSSTIHISCSAECNIPGTCPSATLKSASNLNNTCYTDSSPHNCSFGEVCGTNGTCSVAEGGGVVTCFDGFTNWNCYDGETCGQVYPDCQR